MPKLLPPTLVPVFTAVLVGLCQAYCALLLLTITNHAAWKMAWRFEDPIGAWTFAMSAAFGMLLTFRFRHSYRSLGVLPIALLALIPTLFAADFTDWFCPWTLAPLGFCLGIAHAVCIRYMVAPGRDRWLRYAPIGIPLLATLAIGGMLLAKYSYYINLAARGATSQTLDPELPLTQSLGIALILGLLTLYVFRRSLVESCIAMLQRISYRTRAAGPGLAVFPSEGPVLVIANHAAYFDPSFLGEILPRPITAMMTSGFFDKPFIRQLMVYVFDTIRVGDVPVKREVPELVAAIAALRAGKCVVIFPEGYLRRKDEVPLRRFGRGVWEILRACPETPVVACWIEGSWGSYFSFYNGPPMENKPRDYRRPITIGVSVPETVPAEILAKHLATRLHLMKLVFAARTHLGLPDLSGQSIDALGSADNGD